MTHRYIDRQDAGKQLAKVLHAYQQHKDAIVLALPRGGVPVAYEIANELQLPLDVFIVRKLGVPGHKELAMGALATGDVRLFNNDIIEQLGISKEEIATVIKSEQAELQRRMQLYRGNKPHLAVQDKIIILVDDGVATGATIKVAIKALRQQQPKKIIVAVPVADPTISKEIATLVDEYYCLMQPHNLSAVGLWYENFSQTEDEEVFELLQAIDTSN